MPGVYMQYAFNRYDKNEYDIATEQCIQLIQSSLKHGDLALTAVRH